MQKLSTKNIIGSEVCSQGRYKISEIDTESYFTTIITYIHQNPLAAGLVKNITDYRYSSYNAYLSKKETMIKKKGILEWFGGISGFIEDHKATINQFEMHKRLKI